MVAFSDDFAVLMQAVKPEFELYATSGELNHGHGALGAPNFESAPTSELNYYYALIGTDPLILFKMGEVHGRIMDLSEILPGHMRGSSHEKRQKLQPYKGHQKTLKEDLLGGGGILGIGALLDQYMQMAKKFPTEEIMEVMKPVLRKQDYDAYDESMKEFSQLQRILKDNDFRAMLQRSTDGMKGLIFDEDLEKFLATFKASGEMLSKESDPTKRGMLMRTASDSMKSVVSKISSNAGKLWADMVGGMEKTINKEFKKPTPE